MKKFIFSGLVLPERAPLSISPPIQVAVVDAQGNPTGNVCSIDVSCNQLTIVIESDEPDIYSLRNEVLQLVETLTSVVGFIVGHSYDIEITKVLDVDTTATMVFGIDISVLSQRAAGRDLGMFRAIFPVMSTESGIYLTRCLTDLSMAMRRATDTAFYCFRAIESLRQSFTDVSSEKDQWKRLADALGKGSDARSEMDFVRDHAFPARHGVPKPITDAERQKMFLYTWDLVERYIDFRLREMGLEPLFGHKPEN